MADEYKKISGTEETCGSTGVQQKYVDLTGDGHAQSVYVEDGQLDVTLVVGDIEIGAVELKDATTANRAAITAAGDVQVTLASEVVDVDATGQGDVPVTLDGEAVVLGAGAAAIGKLAANSGVDIGDVDVLSIAAGANIIGKVGIDQTTPGTTNKVVASVASGGIASGAVATGALAAGSIAAGAKVAAAEIDGHSQTLGITTGAAVVTDAAGTVQQYLRGLVKLLVDKITVAIDQTTPGTTNKVVADVPTATPTTYNVTCTVADTEYSQALPANCRGFEFQARTEAVVRYAFATGKVAAPTAPYHTLKANDYYYSPPLNQAAAPSTLYVASPDAGTVVEILAWT